MSRALALVILTASSLSAHELPCSSISNADAQTACHANNRPGKRERHMARMVRCDFLVEPRVELLILAEGPDQDHLSLIANASIKAETCEVPEGDGVWHFTRIGPFSTTGGYSWTSVLTTHDESMHSQWHISHQGRASIFVSDHILGSADNNGELIGYPPIHQHHWHYSHASDPNREMLSTHGDQQCLGGEGVYCQLVEYPGNVAFELVPQLNIFAEFNDVRERGAPPLQWYALGGIFIHNPVENMPKSMQWYQIILYSFTAPLGHRKTLLYDTALESVTWSTGTIPSMDHAVDPYFHAHAEMVDDLWLIAGSPTQLELLSPPWVEAFAETKSGDSVIPQLKAHLRTMMAASDAELICSYNQHPHTEIVEGYPTKVTRRATCPFARGDQGNVKWTMVGFYKAQVSGLPKMYPMHSVVRLAYIAAPGTPNPIDARDCKILPWTLERLASDNGSAVEAMHFYGSDFYGSFKCMLAFFHGDGLSYFFAPNTFYPIIWVAMWASPMLTCALAILLTLSCCAICSPKWFRAILAHVRATFLCAMPAWQHAWTGTKARLLETVSWGGETPSRAAMCSVCSTQTGTSTRMPPKHDKYNEVALL